MFEIFTKLADFVVYGTIGMERGSHLAGSIHFFIEDVTKIYFLLIIMIYTIAWLRASLNVDRVRDYLAGKNR
ncbi:permease, partial [bacterium]|nr:permease [bacterium]